MPEPERKLGQSGFWLPWWLSGKDPTCQAGDTGLIPEWGRSPGEGNGSPLKYSCLGNPHEQRSLGATVHRVAKESDMTYQLNNNNLAFSPHILHSTTFSKIVDDVHGIF